MLPFIHLFPFSSTHLIWSFHALLLLTVRCLTMGEFRHQHWKYILSLGIKIESNGMRIRANKKLWKKRQTTITPFIKFVFFFLEGYALFTGCNRETESYKNRCALLVCVSCLLRNITLWKGLIRKTNGDDDDNDVGGQQPNKHTHKKKLPRRNHFILFFPHFLKLKSNSSSMHTIKFFGCNSMKITTIHFHFLGVGCSHWFGLKQDQVRHILGVY